MQGIAHVHSNGTLDTNFNAQWDGVNDSSYAQSMVLLSMAGALHVSWLLWNPEPTEHDQVAYRGSTRHWRAVVWDPAPGNYRLGGTLLK